MVSRYRGVGYHHRRLPKENWEAIILIAFALRLAQLFAMPEWRIEYCARERG